MTGEREAADRGNAARRLAADTQRRIDSAREAGESAEAARRAAQRQTGSSPQD